MIEIIPSLRRVAAVCNTFLRFILSAVIASVATSIGVGNLRGPVPPQAVAVHPRVPLAHALQVHHHRACSRRNLETSLSTTTTAAVSLSANGVLKDTKTKKKARAPTYIYDSMAQCKYLIPLHWFPNWEFL